MVRTRARSRKTKPGLGFPVYDRRRAREGSPALDGRFEPDPLRPKVVAGGSQTVPALAEERVAY